MSVRFAWDSKKAERNRRVHDGVAFEEAATVFRDPRAYIFYDDKHSDEEYRELIIGYSSRNRLLIVASTARDELIRIISARKADGVNKEPMTMQKDKVMDNESNDLSAHYDFDYGKAKPNRFAERLEQEQLMVVLDPDIAAVFPTSEAVNEALRVLVAAAKNLPNRKRPRKQRQSSMQT